MFCETGVGLVVRDGFELPDCCCTSNGPALPVWVGGSPFDACPNSGTTPINPKTDAASSALRPRPILLGMLSVLLGTNAFQEPLNRICYPACLLVPPQEHLRTNSIIQMELGCWRIEIFRALYRPASSPARCSFPDRSRFHQPSSNSANDLLGVVSEYACWNVFYFCGTGVRSGLP